MASGNPLAHILDHAVVAVDKSGGLRWLWSLDPDAAHERLAALDAAGGPMTIGPFVCVLTKHMLGQAIVAVILCAIAIKAAREAARSAEAGTAPKGVLANIVESLVLFVRDEMVIPVGGRHAAPLTPLFLTYFFFILADNLFGMIPEVGTPTGNIGAALALGLTVLATVFAAGMIKQGPAGFFVHMVPPGTPWWMWPLMFALELIGPIIRCCVLGVRLFSNMIAGHLVISNTLGLAAYLGSAILILGVPLAVGIALLEVLVCFIQAYVFTLLSIIFVGAALHPEH